MQGLAEFMLLIPSFFAIFVSTIYYPFLKGACILNL